MRVIMTKHWKAIWVLNRIHIYKNMQKSNGYKIYFVMIYIYFLKNNCKRNMTHKIIMNIVIILTFEILTCALYSLLKNRFMLHTHFWLLQIFHIHFLMVLYVVYYHFYFYKKSQKNICTFYDWNITCFHKHKKKVRNIKYFLEILGSLYRFAFPLSIW